MKLELPVFVDLSIPRIEQQRIADQPNIVGYGNSPRMSIHDSTLRCAGTHTLHSLSYQGDRFTGTADFIYDQYTTVFHDRWRLDQPSWAGANDDIVFPARNPHGVDINLQE